VLLTERPRSKAIRAEPAPRKYVALYAELVTEIGGRLAGIYEALRGAAGADMDARELWESQLAQRRQGAANVVGDVLRKGELRQGLDREAAADIVWLLNDPGLYHLLVQRRGWTVERFQAWLVETMSRQLLPDQDQERRRHSATGSPGRPKQGGSRAP
jgi:hypothetical protein